MGAGADHRVVRVLERKPLRGLREEDRRQHDRHRGEHHDQPGEQPPLAEDEAKDVGEDEAHHDGNLEDRADGAAHLPGPEAAVLGR